MEKITKSKSTEHHYSEREKEQALQNYREIVVAEVERMHQIYDRYVEQSQHRTFKSEKYDFELHNQLAFDITQGKRRILHAAESIQKNYDTKVEVPDFDLLFENYSQNKK